ncbi:hypothetical protein Cgig2_002877 [Carnegiea gigantea]|uniref:Uncharacterized protein n=1 Tax=Carnegiea gigantea TaxID=171969 RepID=A0A9Q1QNM9_9CARY|nr:hypothetical protein Cgig2_002877 [Carnegiea gigantea]
MEMVLGEKDLRAAGAEVLTDGRRGLRIRGWEMVSCKDSILNSFHLQLWEEQPQTSHLTEMVFGNSSLILKHVPSGTKSHFNAFDALTSWKLEGLPPVKVPAAAKVKFRSLKMKRFVHVKHRAWELKNFLIQKLHEKILTGTGLEREPGSSALDDGLGWLYVGDLKTTIV